MVVSPSPLTQETLALAVRELAAGDPDLSAIVERSGPPPMWGRPAGFPTLVHIVLEQQVSLASAQAAFDRLRSAVDALTPDRFLELDDARLLAIGFSRQKARCVRGVARAVASGTLDLEGLALLADEDVHRALVAQTGVGPWTAAIYLLIDPAAAGYLAGNGHGARGSRRRGQGSGAPTGRRSDAGTGDAVAGVAVRRWLASSGTTI